VNKSKLETAMEINGQIECINLALKQWEGGGERLSPPHARHWNLYHEKRFAPPLTPKADRAWLDYVARVVEELTTQRDQLKREFEVL
jgi:hypothetical protein